MVASLTPLTSPDLGDLRKHGDAPALVLPDGRLTYAELADAIDNTAARLTGERQLVLVAGGSTLQTVVSYLAALAHGHVALLAPDRDDVARAMIDAYDPDAVLLPGTGAITPRRDGSAHVLHPDLALLLATSGSTGSPKLVRLSHRAVQANATSIATYLGLSSDDRGLLSLPLHYSYGLSVLNSHLAVGAGLVLAEGSVIDDELWRAARAGGATSLPGVPHTFDLLDSRDFRGDELPTLRRMTQAGGRMRPEQVLRYAAKGREHGWELFVMYGQTEATARIAYLPPHLAHTRPGALGVAVPGGSLRIEPVPETRAPGVGELVYRGDNVMMGYATEPDDLARGAELAELRTGDLAVQDADGIFSWVGRRARFAKVFGLRLDLDAIERRLDDDGVTAACLDDGDGLALVVQQPADAGAVARRVAAECGVPIHAIAARGVTALPRTLAGKPDRAAILALAHEPPAVAPPVGDAVRSTFAAVLDLATVDDRDTFVSLGGDSLSYVEMSVRLEELGLALPADWHRRPVGDLSSTTVSIAGTPPRTDVSILLRALAIVLIVGSHGNLWAVAGGAHLLLAVAGFNFARFRLTETSRRRRTRHGLGSLRRLATASAAWIGAVALVAGTYQPATALLLNGVLGSDTWTTQWQFWFIEALVWTQLCVVLVLAVPFVHRLERAAPFGFASGVLLAAAAARYALVGLEAGPTERYTPIVVAWCFAVGWLAGVATSRRHRIVVSVAAAAVVPGFFGDPLREALVVAGVLLLIWVPGIVVPRQLARVASTLAAASLYIYLTHWQIYPHFEDWSPVLALTVSLAAGVAYWQAWSRLTSWPARRRLAPVGLGR